jgi:hypothetical protein
MKRYFGGLMFLISIMATFQVGATPGKEGAVGVIWLFLGIPGAIWLFRKQKPKE